MKQKLHGWIAASIPDSADEKPYFVFLGHKPSGEVFVPVREHSFEVEIPDDFDFRPAAVAAIDEKISELRADFTKEVTELQGQRNRLLALEM